MENKSWGINLGQAGEALQSVGVPVWDKDHRTVFEQIEKLQNAELSQNGVKHVMISLMHFIEVHLHSEELAMVEMGYPDYEAHKEQHNGFRQWFKEQNKIRLTSPDEFNTQALADFLYKWWVNHIHNADMAYKNFFTTKRDELSVHLRETQRRHLAP